MKTGSSELITQYTSTRAYDSESKLRLRALRSFDFIQKLLKAAERKEVILNRLKPKTKRSSKALLKKARSRITILCCTVELLWK
jgi:hypothetical protein